MARAAAVVELSEDEERELRAVLRRPSVPQQQALRARIVLRAAQGATNTQIAAEAGVSLPTVGLWRRNFCERRLEGLSDAPRSGRTVAGASAFGTAEGIAAVGAGACRRGTPCCFAGPELAGAPPAAVAAPLPGSPLDPAVCPPPAPLVEPATPGAALTIFRSADARGHSR